MYECKWLAAVLSISVLTQPFMFIFDCRYSVERAECIQL